MLWPIHFQATFTNVFIDFNQHIFFLNVFQVAEDEHILYERKIFFTYQTYWPEKEKNSGRAAVKNPNVTSLLYYMGKNELFTKVLKSLNKVTSKHSQDIQLYSNIARDILVWVFLPSSLLFKTSRTQWFDNDLIARYFQFEYSKAS